MQKKKTQINKTVHHCKKCWRELIRFTEHRRFRNTKIASQYRDVGSEIPVTTVHTPSNNVTPPPPPLTHTHTCMASQSYSFSCTESPRRKKQYYLSICRLSSIYKIKMLLHCCYMGDSRFVPVLDNTDSILFFSKDIFLPSGKRLS